MHSLNPNTIPVHITGRKLNRKLRDASASERAVIIDDLRTGRLIITDFTTGQTRQLAAVSLVAADRRPPDEERRAARLDHQADLAVERLGVDRIFRALDKITSPQLAAAE